METVSSDIIYLAVLLAIFLFLSGCFSATETGFFSLDRIERRQFLEDKSKKSRLISWHLKHPREFLSMILFGNTLVNVATSATAVILFAKLIVSHNLIVAITVDVLLVLIIGEILPKTIAISNARKLTTAVIQPMHIFSKVSRPLVSIFDYLSGAILKMIRVPEEFNDVLDSTELEMLINEANKNEMITPQERQLARNIFRFSKTTAEKIMTPRVNIKAAPINITPDELKHIMIEVRHSRIPVYEERLDNIAGFINTKEFFLNPGKPILEMINPVCVFPESAKIHHIFHHMKINRFNMAVIVDEFGATSGILTIEDIVEEIVGEIYDEYEKAESIIKCIGENEWIVICSTPVELVNETCHLSIQGGEHLNLNGYLCNEFGRIPVSGEKLEKNGLIFEIIESKKKKIISCRIKKKNHRGAENND
ncbi:MAG: hemolysin family protein [Petrotogales bacterium]